MFMATVIKNYKQLERAMNQVIKDGLADTAKEVNFVIDDFLERWYGDYIPKQYKRTGQFLYSCVTSKVVKNGNQYKTKIFIDYRNMKHFMEIPDSKGKTRPLSKAEELEIVQNANMGIHGIETGEKGFTEFRFWDEAENYLDRKDFIVKAFYDYLVEKGFDVSIIRDGGMSF